MKALSLWQPYASFMRDDLKWIETRGRATNIRGELAICSAQRNWMPGEFGSDVEDLANRMGELWLQQNKLKPRADWEILFPKGFVLCVVDLFDCQPTAGLKVQPLENVVGNYSAGRFAWFTRNCRKLKTPVPVIGHQGFFNLPAEVEAQVLAQL